MRFLSTWIALFSLSPIAFAASEIPIDGTVLAEQAPLAGAEIRLLPWRDEVDPGWVALHGKGPRPVAVTHSGAGGAFRLLAPSMGLWKVRVEAPGRLGREMLLEPLLGALRLPAVELEPAADIEVQVSEAEGGTAVEAYLAWPAAQDRQRAAAGIWQPVLSLAATDPRGSGRLRVRLDGPREIVAVASGFLPARASWSEGKPNEIVRVILKRGLSRAVEVTDLEGVPLPGTWLYSEGGPLPLARTGRRGMALIPAPESQPMALTLISPERRGTWKLAPPETGSEGEAATVRLAAPRKVRGKLVERGNARPVGGALVWGRPTSGNFAITGADGAFVLALAGDSAGSLAVAMPGGGAGGKAPRTLVDCGKYPPQDPPARGSAGTVAAAGDRPSSSLCYQPLARARPRLGVGEVLSEDLEPVEGAEVRWTRSAALEEESTPLPTRGRRREDAVYFTDEHGRFEVPDPLPGRYLLEVRAAGFAPLRVPGVEIPGGTGELDLGVVTLSPGARIEGWVVDPGGRAVAGAEILVGEPGTAPADVELLMSGVAAAATSDGRGHFAIRDLPPGDDFYMRVEKAGFQPREYPALRLPMFDALEVVLTPASTVRGRVVDRQGQGVDGALVTVHGGEPAAPDRDRGAGGTSRQAMSSPEGDFEVEGVRPGRLAVVATAPGFRQARWTDFEVEAGDVLEGLELVLERGTTLTGTVRDGAGDPVAGATVVVTSPASDGQPEDSGGALSRTDGAGRYRFSGLDPGQHLVTAEDDGGRRGSRQVDVAPGQDVRQVDLTLEGGVEVSGWARNGDDGAPVAGATILLVDGSGGRQSSQTRTGDDGRFLFAGVPSGRYFLLAYGTGFAPGRPGSPVVVESYPIADLEVTLAPGHTLRGQVVGLAFEDLPRVVIRAPGVASAVGVNHEGFFTLTDLPAGDVLLEAQVAGSERKIRQRVALPSGSSAVTLDFEFGDQSR